MKSKRIVKLIPLCGGLLFCMAAAGDDTLSGKMTMVKYHDVSESDQYTAHRLGDYCERLGDWLIPTPDKPLKVRVFYSRTGKTYRLGASQIGREVRIYLPPNSRSWTKDRETIGMLLSWFILARLGQPPEKEPLLRDHWMITALIRKTETGLDSNAPMIRMSPGVYPLTAAGIYPEVRKVIDGRIKVFEGPGRALQAEYAEQLLELCSRAGLIRASLAEMVLKHQVVLQDKTSQYDLFLKYARPVLRKKLPLEFAVEPTLPQLDGIVEKWWRDYLKQSQISRFMPRTTGDFEVAYREAARWSMADAEGKDGHKTYPLYELAVKREQCKDLEAVISGLIARLNELSLTSAPEFQKPLSNLRQLLSKCRTEGGESLRDELRAGEKSIYEAINARYALELYLQEAENRYVPLSMRYGTTMKLLDEHTLSDRSLQPEVNALLDQWDK